METEGDVSSSLAKTVIIRDLHHRTGWVKSSFLKSTLTGWRFMVIILFTMMTTRINLDTPLHGKIQAEESQGDASRGKSRYGLSTQSFLP